MESRKYAEARDLFTKVSGLYFKGQNYFGAAEMSYKAGECSFQLKEYEKAVESFMKASEIALNKGFDRYGISALQQALESEKALGNTEKVEELSKKIAELNKKQEEPEGESSFSVFS
jgi:tetratricopeptide (TPR) repeat protein